MKAIETEYNGYLFRSRVEARWAVFLTALQIKFEYEFEGYHLGDKMYLPDFYLPDHGVYIEVKGEKPNEEEMGKAFLLARESGKPVILAFGGFYIDRSIEYLTTVSPGCFVFWGTASQWWNHSFNNSDRFIINKGWSLFNESRMISLINFLKSKNMNVSYNGTAKSWQKVVDKDKEYYDLKYGIDHPLYKYGVVDKDLCVFDISKYVTMANAYDHRLSERSLRAYTQASKARFEGYNG